MTTVIIYHNPQCGTSRNTLGSNLRCVDETEEIMAALERFYAGPAPDTTVL